MSQPSPLYAASPATQLLEPSLQARLPKVVSPTARAHIIQLAAALFERQSARTKERRLSGRSQQRDFEH